MKNKKNKEKISISIDPELLDYIDEKKKTNNPVLSRSQMIEKTIRFYKEFKGE